MCKQNGARLSKEHPLLDPSSSHSPVVSNYLKPPFPIETPVCQSVPARRSVQILKKYENSEKHLLTHAAAFGKKRSQPILLLKRRDDLKIEKPKTQRNSMKKMLFPVAVGLVLASPVAWAVTDDFSDLNDTANPTWTHLSGLLGSTGQAWDASGANYRLTAPNNGAILGGAQYGFVGSHLAGTPLTDSYVSADFVAHTGNGAHGVYGIAARLNGLNGFNALKGYSYAYEPFAAGGVGEMVLYRITGANLSDLGAQAVTLDPLKDYTFHLEITGTQLHGWVEEVGGPIVASKSAVDATYASGTPGVFGYGINPGTSTDFTIDNFSAVPEPSSLAVAGLGLLGLAIRNARRMSRS
jgi:hypothetical protein